MKSTHSPAERDEAQRRFNNPKEKVDCLIISMALGSLGMNLHHACRSGMIIEWPPNAPTVSQTIGRLWRLGAEQAGTINWDIVKTSDSLDSYQESRLMHKQAVVLAAEGNIPDQITGQLRLICAYELLREMFGQEFNRYPMARVPWDRCDSDEVRREGLFYSQLAVFLMKTPRYAERITRENMEGIARCWEPGMPVVKQMIVDPSANARQGGVILRNYCDYERSPAADDSTGRVASVGSSSTSSTSRRILLRPVKDADRKAHEAIRFRNAKEMW